MLSYGIGAWDAFLYENYTYHREMPFVWHQHIGFSYFFEARYLVQFLINQVLKDTTLTILTDGSGGRCHVHRQGQAAGLATVEGL